jgi:hypothetical protein
LIVAALTPRGGFGQRHARFTCQLLNGFGETKAFGCHQELEDITMLTRGEAMVEALLIVDKKRWRFLGFEGRQAAKFSALALQRHLPPNDLTYRQASTDFIKQGG